MGKNRRVNIPISRFRADLELDCAIFIHLPRNQRFVKLVEEGGSFDASQLHRLTNSGISHLQVNWDPAKGDNPDAYQLFRTVAPDVQTPPDPAEAPSASTAVSEASAGPAPSPSSDQPPAPLLPAAAATEPTPAASPEPAPSAESESTVLAPSPELASSESLIAAAETEPETTQTITAADPAEKEPEQRFAASKTESPEEAEQRFSGESTPLPSQRLVSGKADTIPEEEQRFSSSAEETDKSQFRVTGTTETPSENRTLRSTAESPESVRKFSQNTAEEDNTSFSLKNDEAPSKNEEMAIARASGSRDFHVTLSRLAARLGHCLGYQNTGYLADLGITAVYHFSRKAGHQPDESAAPELTRATLSTSYDSPSQAAVTDAQDVLRFLDAYIDQPDCDHSDKDFSPKLLERVMGKLEGSHGDAVDCWSLRKWATMLTTAETIDAHSTCTKASAKATKYVKSNFADEALPR